MPSGGIALAGSSVLGSVVGGRNQRRAAERGAQAQETADLRAIESNEQALAQSRADAQPFRGAGVGALNPLLAASTATPYQHSYTQQHQYAPLTQDNVVDNKLFSSLFDKSARTIEARNAAGGKLNSGDTLQDLMTESLGIGSQLFQQDYNNRFRTNQQNFDNRFRVNQQNFNNKQVGFNNLFNVASMGANAAARQGTATLNTAFNNANLNRGIGSANAEGQRGAANATNSTINNLLGIGRYALGGGFNG